MQPLLQLDDEAEDEELEDESDGNHSNTLTWFTVKLNELFLYHSSISQIVKLEMCFSFNKIKFVDKKTSSCFQRCTF